MGDEEGDNSAEPEWDVAITRNVVRSNRITSVALQALANVARCFESTAAFGIRVWTIFDHA